MHKHRWLAGNRAKLHSCSEYVLGFPGGVWTQQPGCRPCQRPVQPDGETRPEALELERLDQFLNRAFVLKQTKCNSEHSWQSFLVPASRGEVRPLQPRVRTAHHNHAIVSHHLSQKNKFLSLKRLRGPLQSNLLFSGAAAKRETSVDGRADGGGGTRRQTRNQMWWRLQSARKDSHSLQIPQIVWGGAHFWPDSETLMNYQRRVAPPFRQGRRVSEGYTDPCSFYLPLQAAALPAASAVPPVRKEP